MNQLSNYLHNNRKLNKSEIIKSFILTTPKFVTKLTMEFKINFNSFINSPCCKIFYTKIPLKESNFPRINFPKIFIIFFFYFLHHKTSISNNIQKRKKYANLWFDEIHHHEHHHKNHIKSTKIFQQLKNYSNMNVKKTLVFHKQSNSNLLYSYSSYYPIHPHFIFQISSSFFSKTKITTRQKNQCDQSLKK